MKGRPKPKGSWGKKSKGVFSGKAAIPKNIGGPSYKGAKR